MIIQDQIKSLKKRLKSIGIEIQVLYNVPWIYLVSVNGKPVDTTEYKENPHILSYYPTKFSMVEDEKIFLNDIGKTFSIIREIINT